MADKERQRSNRNHQAVTSENWKGRIDARRRFDVHISQSKRCVTLDRINVSAGKQCNIKAAAIVTGQTNTLRIWSCSRRQKVFLVKVIEAVEIEDFLQGDNIGVHLLQKLARQSAIDRVQAPVFRNVGIPSTMESILAVNTLESEILNI